MVLTQEVGSGIYMIDLHSGKRVWSCEAYLVVDEKAAVIETGPTSVVPDLLEGMRQVGLDLSRLAYIIVTHVHVDHAGGAGALAREAPQAKVVVHQRGARHLEDPSRLIESTRQVQGEELYQTAGPVIPIPQDRLWPVSGGEEISLGGRELLVIDAPGHAPHHICLYDRLSGGVFVGEAVGTYGRGRERPMSAATPPSFDLEQNLDSLARLRALKSSVFFFSHSGVHRQPQQALDMAEEDHRAYGRIVLEGMRERATFQEICQRFANYYEQMGGQVRGQGGEFRNIAAGFVSYFRRQDPSLEMPR